jgi:hypothetical protein
VTVSWVKDSDSKQVSVVYACVHICMRTYMCVCVVWHLGVSHAVPAGRRKVTAAFFYITEHFV